MKTAIEMAREAGFVNEFEECAAMVWVQDTEITEIIEALVALVRADEREICSALDFRKEIGLTSDQDYKVSQLILFGGST